MDFSTLSVAFGLSAALNAGLLAHAVLRDSACPPCAPTIPFHEVWQPRLSANAAQTAVRRRLRANAASVEATMLAFDYSAHFTPERSMTKCNVSYPHYSQLAPGQGQMCPGLNDTTVLVTVKDCGSMFLCSLSPGWRAVVKESDWYQERAARHIPGTDIPLLVPIQKINGYPRSESKLIQPPPDGGPQVFPPWPERKEVLNVNLGRFRNGDAFETCRKALNIKIHWFCTHLSPNYGADHKRAVSLMKKANVFERQDVRLVFDLAGSVGAFAEALHHYYGDRIVCITGDSFITPGKPGADNSIEWPSQRILAAKGLPSVMIDGVSFLPFGESTLDALHTSWFFHHGIPWTTLWEMYRVIRPGGFLVLRSFPAWVRYNMWPLYAEWAESMKMRNVFHVDGGSIGSIQIFQMPLTKEWLNRTHHHEDKTHRTRKPL